MIETGEYEVNIAVLEEDRLSFISYQSEAEDEEEEEIEEDQEMGFTSELSDIEENPLSTNDSPGHGQEGMQLCLGNQVLKISDKLSELLQDTDPVGIFSQVYPPGSEAHAKQMSIMQQILRDNPDFQLSDLEFDSDLSNLTQGKTQEEEEEEQEEEEEKAVRGEDQVIGPGQGRSVEGQSKGVQVERSLEGMDPAEKSCRTVDGDGGNDSSAHSREEAEPGITECLMYCGHFDLHGGASLLKIKWHNATCCSV